MRADSTVRQLEKGPRVSGVFAQPDAAGDEIALLDPEGEVERTLGPGAGLVAATELGEEAPTWVVTGTDAVGLAAAAAQLQEEALRNHFAIAVEDGRPDLAPAAAAAGDAVTYLRRASPLHATRAAVASAWCVALALVALSFEHPLVLTALLGAVVAAAAAARVGAAGAVRARPDAAVRAAHRPDQRARHARGPHRHRPARDAARGWASST